MTMKVTMTLHRLFAAATLLLALAALPARAQEWRVSVTPYAWLPGVTGDITTPLPGFGNRTSSLSSGGVVTSIDALPVMLAGEVGYGRFSLMGDFLYSALRQDISTRDVLHNGGHSRVSTTLGTLMLGFRALELPAHTLDLAAGVRMWNVDTKLSLDPGRAPGRIVRATSAWADPILALRYSGRFNERWGATVYGDIGGFDTGSRLTWQVIGSVDYAWSQSTTLRAGWRYLAFERGSNAVTLDLAMNGPFLAATFRF